MVVVFSGPEGGLIIITFKTLEELILSSFPSNSTDFFPLKKKSTFPDPCLVSIPFS